MALFGKADDEAKNEVEVDRLESLPLEALAAEVLSHFDSIDLEFGSWGPTLYEVAEAIAPTKLKGAAAKPMVMVVGEGLQVLEHARLVRLSIGDAPSFDLQFVLTRAGRDAMERGDVSERLRSTLS